MPWTTPADQTTGTLVTASMYNTQGQDDLSFLYGDTGWTNVATFTNSWSSFQTVRYILIGRVVYLDGVMNAGTAASAAFTLPVGYRPSSTNNFTCWTNAGVAVNIVAVSGGGVVTPVQSTGVWLNTIRFPVV
jgi:hypothetical protein